MSKKPETLFKERVQKDLKAVHKATGAVWFVKTQQVCIRGTPDLLLGVCGLLVAIELKGTIADRLDPLQWHTLDLINKAGNIGCRADPSNWTHLLEILKVIAHNDGLSPESRRFMRDTIGFKPRQSGRAARLAKRVSSAKSKRRSPGLRGLKSL